MAANYGTGAWGKGNYSAPTGSVLTAAAGAYSETGQTSGLSWGAKALLSFGGFGLTGLAGGLWAGFAGVVAAGIFALAGRPAGFVWGALAAADPGLFVLAGDNLSLAAQWSVTAAESAVALAGPEAGLLSGNVWVPVAAQAGGWNPVDEGGDPWVPASSDQTSWTLQ
jgi:hypothetical protein